MRGGVGVGSVRCSDSPSFENGFLALGKAFVFFMLNIWSLASIQTCYCLESARMFSRYHEADHK